MAVTKHQELANALRLANRLEELSATNQNCGQVVVQTTYGRNAPGWIALMEFIQDEVQAQFEEIRSRAISEARTQYEVAMRELAGHS